MTAFPSIPGYQLTGLLGHGGTAVVYRATNLSNEREVAIKIIAQSLAAHATFKKRFVKEGRIAQSLTHTHILPVYDIGETPDHLLYIVMALAPNGDLRQRLRQKVTPLSLLENVRHIVSALQYVHQKGFIHRDIKPENIIFSEDNTALLADFGISKATQSGDTQLTKTGMLVGTPAYMSPEQVQCLPLDGRSDLYSVGILLFEILEGKKPFAEKDIYALVLMQINTPVPPLSSRYHKVQPVVDRLLQKKPEDRYADAGSLLEALDQVLAQSEGTFAINLSDLPATLEELNTRWQHQQRNQWTRPETFLALGKQAIEMAHAVLAVDILSVGLKKFYDHLPLQYTLALALTRCGSFARADEVSAQLLSHLSENDPLFIDAQSLAGRIAKDRWARLPDGDEKTRAGEVAFAAYAAAYRVEHDYFPGINAATIGLLLHLPAAKKMAYEVKQWCEKALTDADQDDYWLRATLGEVHLILNQQQQARVYYQQALAIVGGRVGDLASMRRQISMIAQYLPVDQTTMALFSGQKTAVFSGHMMDAPSRDKARFPPGLECAVFSAIQNRIVALGIRVGYCSLACGSDILFAEALFCANAEVHVILPFDKNDFIEVSVAFGGPHWVGRFENALKRATSITYTTEERWLHDPSLFSLTNALLQGTAILRAQQLVMEPVMLAVLEPEALTKAGGTQESVQQWQAYGHPLHLLDLKQIRDQDITLSDTVIAPLALVSAHQDEPSTATPIDDRACKGSTSNPVRREIKSLLFIGLEGGEELDKSVPKTRYYFVTELMRALDASTTQPSFKNTWGHGLYLVFDHLEQAADVALTLRDAIEQTDWQQYALPRRLDIRMTLHCCAVFSSPDPVYQQTNYYGTQIDFVTQMERLTAPCSIYISEQTAALLVGYKQFANDYIGEVPLTNHRNIRLYRLRRSGETD